MKTLNKNLVLAIICLFIGAGVVPSISSDNPSFGNTIYVDDNADPSWYDATHVKTIQEGIDNATVGDTVFVFNGTYYEQVIIDKKTNLIGESRDSTIIDGNGNKVHVVEVLEDSVNISNLSVRNSRKSTWYDAGIWITSDFSKIENCNLYDNMLGIYSDYASYMNLINCISHDNSNMGYRLMWGSNNIIHDCTTYNNAYKGIKITGENHTISNCLSYNTWDGIRCASCFNTTIVNTTTRNNRIGIQVLGSSNNIIENNTINSNWEYGVHVDCNSHNNNIIHNNFISNGGGVNQAYNEGSNNIWDNGYPSGGNYFDDYTGVDNYHGVNQDIPGSDGIGDTPYPITGGSNQDNYPLMELYTGFYYDDFEDVTLDKWNVISGDWEVLTEPSGNHIAHLNIASEEGRRMVSKETIDDNVIITAEIKGDSNDIDQSADKMVGFYSNSACTNFYYVSVEYPISIGYWNGISSVTLSINWSIFTNNEIWYNVEIKLENNNIFAKTWEIGAEEPNHWQVSYYGATGFGNHLVIGTNGGIQDEEFWFDDIFVRNLSITPPPDTVYVDDNYTSSTPGWQYDHFDVIQDGIDAVAENGTVYVFNGTYYENVVVGKTINLTGENRDSTIIDGGGTGDVVYVSSDWVNISSLSFSGSGTSTLSDAGLEIDHASHFKIKNCDFLDNGEIGIRFNYATDIEILKCLFWNNHIGIYTRYCSNIQIKNCTCFNNVLGMRIDHSSYQVNIVNCTTAYNSNTGIALIQGSHNNIIKNCVSNDNSYRGIYFAYGVDGPYPQENQIIDCEVFNNGHGIVIESSINNMVIQNYIHHNTIYGIECVIDWGGPSNNNLIYQNSFISNSQNAYDICTNFWYNATLQKGNYWDDYTGTDADGDGIGDIPYNVSGGNNQDIYPLGWFHPIADAGGPYYGTICELIQFDGSGSYDPDVHGFVDSARGIVRYEWDFGDGHNGSGMKPTHEYSYPGEYQVNLTVWDNDGATDTNYTFSSIGLQIPPQADANGPYEGHVGKSVQFHGSATGGEPPYTWNWDFGNGYSSSLQNPIYIYGETGVYTVVLTVADDNDNSDDDTTTATIYPENVLLADAGGPYSGFVNESVQFYGNASGGEPPYSWYWEFGDGNTSVLQNPTHIYDKVGEYDVILTVTDNFGQNDNDKAFVKILPQDDEPPLVSIQKPDKGKLYIRNRMIFPIFLTTVIIGDIVVEAYAIDEITGVSRVEFYLDDNFQFSISSEPYVWTWDESAFGKRTIRVTAYDKAGNSASDEIEVWKFF